MARRSPRPKTASFDAVRIAVVSLAVLALIPLLIELSHLAATWGWQPVTATVVGMRHEPYRVGYSSTTSPPSVKTAYRDILVYSYSVDGTEYGGMEEYPGGPGDPSSQRVVYYNPSKPSKSTLRQPSATLLAAGLVADITLVILLSPGRTSRRRMGRWFR
jgi:hypothetical protein